MCFPVNSNSKLWTAKKDIIVYKVLRKTRPYENYSTIMGFWYLSHTTYKLNKPLKVVDGSVDVGFHSFIKVCVWDRYTTKLVEFVIPKGAKYMRSRKYNVYVSTSIRSGSLEALT